MSPDRRQFLVGAATVSVGGVAGCVGGDGGGGGDDPEETPTEEAPPELRLDEGRALRSVFPTRLVDGATGDEVVEVHWHDDGGRGHWHRQPVRIEQDSYRSLRFVAMDRTDEEIPIGDVYGIRVRRSEETPADLVEVEVNGDVVGISGASTGTGVLFIQITRDGEELWLSPPLEVEVE